MGEPAVTLTSCQYQSRKLTIKIGDRQPQCLRTSIYMRSRTDVSRQIEPWPATPTEFEPNSRWRRMAYQHSACHDQSVALSSRSHREARPLIVPQTAIIAPTGRYALRQPHKTPDISLLCQRKIIAQLRWKYWPVAGTGRPETTRAEAS